MSEDFVETVSARVRKALEHLTYAESQLLKDPHPGLTTWMSLLAGKLEAAQKEIDHALHNE